MAMRIAYAVARQIADHALEQQPREACGLLAGEGDHITRALPLRNIAPAPRQRFHADPNEELRALKAIDEARLRCVGVYHSHPASPPVPSPADIDASADTDWLHLIVSLQRDQPRLKLWRIKPDAVAPIELVFDTDELESPDAPLTRAQQAAIIAAGIVSLLLVLIVAWTLLPAPPNLASP